MAKKKASLKERQKKATDTAAKKGSKMFQAIKKRNKTLENIMRGG